MGSRGDAIAGESYGAKEELLMEDVGKDLRYIIYKYCTGWGV